jgi:hypothetical protein
MFEVGQKLWFVRSYRAGGPQEVTVEKVGRRWATLNIRLRCDASGCVDGGQYSSPGHCYVSREAYELKMFRIGAWQGFKRSLERATMPDHLTTDELTQIAEQLGI